MTIVATVAVLMVVAVAAAVIRFGLRPLPPGRGQGSQRSMIAGVFLICVSASVWIVLVWRLLVSG